MHCHNTFSNYRNGSARMPFDCGVTIEDQLQAALLKKIDVLFVTNHNTLDGYRQICNYQENHAKFRSIKIYPAEEVTIDNQGHVLAYGIHTNIRSRMTNGIRERAASCDIMESFNSNNVDRFSNVVACKFAKDNNIPAIGGSDSHVVATIGRCVNLVEAENNLDSIIPAMMKGTLSISQLDYASKYEIFEHAFYIISSSRDLLLTHALENHHLSVYRMAKWAIDSYVKNHDTTLWRSVGALALHLSKRISEKVNIKGHDSKVFEDRPWKRLISMSLLP
jgi:predicted metal-dependent phosphoesterase TrpH